MLQYVEPCISNSFDQIDYACFHIFVSLLSCNVRLKNFICNNVFVLFTIRSFATVEP